MIEISVDPFYHIGSFAGRWIAVWVVLSVIAAIIITILEARRKESLFKHAVGFCLSVIIGAIIGGRIFYIIANSHFYLDNPLSLLNFQPLVLYGTPFGIGVAIFIYTRVNKLRFWRAGDLIAPGLMLAFSLNRIGCILNGCCYGLPANLPWSVVYTHPDTIAPLGIALHPTQIYHLVLGLVVFAVLWVLKKRLQPGGSLFLLWLVLYSATDLLVRFYRVAEPFIGNWQLAQLVDSMTAVIALLLLVLKARLPRTTCR